MDVKIGVSDNPRELVITSEQAQEEVEKLVSAALSESGGVLSLEDDKGRRFVVPSARIAYVEIGTKDARPVGFLK